MGEIDAGPALSPSVQVEDLVASRATYLRTWEGWLYLVAVQDVSSPAIVGWAMDSHMRTELVLDGLRLAIAQRRPAPGLVWRSITAASSTLGDMLNLRGVDVDRVKDELQSFVTRTNPAMRPATASSDCTPIQRVAGSRRSRYESAFFRSSNGYIPTGETRTRRTSTSSSRPSVTHVRDSSLGLIPTRRSENSSGTTTSRLSCRRDACTTSSGVLPPRSGPPGIGTRRCSQPVGGSPPFDGPATHSNERGARPICAAAA